MNCNNNPPKDTSNNTLKTTLFIDASDSIFDFPKFHPLEPCKDDKNEKNPNQLSLMNKKKLNTQNDNYLNMKINNILNDIRKQKEQNSQDKIVKDNILTLIDDINTSYNTIFSANHNMNNRRNTIFRKKSNLVVYDNPYSSFLRRLSPPPPPPPPKPINYKYVNIDIEINVLNDMLDLCEKYPLQEDVKYNIDMKKLHNIKVPLRELNNMIGMNALKTSIVDQIIFFIQNLHKNDKHNNDFMHTVLCGPPGTGKTEVAKIMGNIFSKMGVLSRNKFKKVTRADMIAGYLGQTAIKTKEVISSALGGVLFIDEAYSLGNREKRDSFAKEAIDTLCEGLSDHKDDLMVIIAGYEDDLNKCFFNYNKGLDSRFTWRFNIDDYTSQELKLIFEKKIKDIGWELKSKNEIPISWFEKNMSYFTYFGRDMETLLAKTKIAHGKRVFCKKESEKKKITLKDLDNGFSMYLDNNEVKKRGKSDIPYNLYT